MAFNPAGLLADSVKEIRIESAWLPALTFADPFADSPPSPVASIAGGFLRPVVITTLAGGYQHRAAPYGEPGPTRWPLVQAGLLIGALLLATWYLYPSKRKRLE